MEKVEDACSGMTGPIRAHDGLSTQEFGEFVNRTQDPQWTFTSTALSIQSSTFLSPSAIHLRGWFVELPCIHLLCLAATCSGRGILHIWQPRRAKVRYSGTCTTTGVFVHNAQRLPCADLVEPEFTDVSISKGHFSLFDVARASLVAAAQLQMSET